MLVKRPRRNYDDDVYDYLEFSYISYACYSIFIYSPDVYLCLFIWFSALPDLSFYVKTVLCVCCATMLLRWHTVIEYYKYPKLGIIKQSKFYGKNCSLSGSILQDSTADLKLALF